MFESIGERIAYCRNLLGYTRKKLVEDFQHISLPTISRWELNYVSIPENKLNKLITFFNQNGLNVSENWIKSGKGVPPINSKLIDISEKSFDEVSYTSLASIKQQIKCFEFKQIQSNFFSPIISYGDYVGGVIQTDYKNLDKKLCIVISEHQTDVGFFNVEELSIYNINNQSINYRNKIFIIGELMCLTKRP